MEGAMSLPDLPHERVLLVLSDAYASAMHHDMTDLGKRSTSQEILLFGGHRDIDGVHRVPANRELRNHLGGTVATVNLRSAGAWLACDQSLEFWSTRLESDWAAWTNEVALRETYNRVRTEDSEVIRLVKLQQKQSPGISRTKALRALRDQGVACEQSRFQSLFESAGA